MNLGILEPANFVVKKSMELIITNIKLTRDGV